MKIAESNITLMVKDLEQSIGIITQDFDEGRSILLSHSIEFKEESGKSGKFLNFQDPDGTWLYFMKPEY